MKPYGKLIGASLGPGDPDLITRRAWSALQSGARWLYPVKKAEESSYALSIVERGGLAIPGDAVELVFPMTRDADILAKAWARAAMQTVELLAEGRDLVFLVEGDASTFATFGHLARVVREQVPEVEVETIPGVSSFAAAAATTGVTLAEEDETFAVIPAAYGVEVINHLLDEFDTLALLKVKPLVDEVIDLLEKRELLGSSVFIEKVGSPEERIVRDVASLKNEKVNYLSLMLVQNPKRVRGELRRGCRKRQENKEKPMPESLSLRPASPDDALAIAELIGDLAHYFVADPQAASVQPFLSTFKAQAITDLLGKPDFVAWCAESQGELQGIITLHRPAHLHHLFVRPAAHRRGIARQLWQLMQKNLPAAAVVTVNSSEYAVPVYQRLGFTATAEVQERNGVRYVPMQAGVSP